MQFIMFYSQPTKLLEDIPICMMFNKIVFQTYLHISFILTGFLALLLSFNQTKPSFINKYIPSEAGISTLLMIYKESYRLCYYENIYTLQL